MLLYNEHKVGKGRCIQMIELECVYVYVTDLASWAEAMAVVENQCSRLSLLSTVLLVITLTSITSVVSGQNPGPGKHGSHTIDSELLYQ